MLTESFGVSEKLDMFGSSFQNVDCPFACYQVKQNLFFLCYVELHLL